MKKKKVSVSVEEDLFNKIEQKTEELGISKSAFISFSTSFFLHQLEHTELAAGDRDVNVYELIKSNIEAQQEAKEMSKNSK
ncbi:MULTISPECIES: hypothetical protein [Pontibacillus]|uniref:Uncharacterized protein n=1 Tax=Pontibacillus marinus BH030004 = DSM 16465 TaxID=1385511 RepID=A0A0A5G258_9BACI|nr:MULTISPECIES: hypothetical protein [Pontibacillus]KGX85165.1 hypothetical protein N783_11450 [Pontibacillus marinus BH030004 = DSM 16465]QHE53613.1 hypothetical protein GS400_17035 [Pontibacillus sp. HMF3514]